jgi:hypothetical protein
MSKPRRPHHQEFYVAIMRIIISLILLICGILVITAPNSVFPDKFEHTVQMLASGWIGAVIGYWLA